MTIPPALKRVLFVLCYDQAAAEHLDVLVRMELAEAVTNEFTGSCTNGKRIEKEKNCGVALATWP